MKNQVRDTIIIFIMFIFLNFVPILGQTNLTPYTSNPVLGYGTAGSWDAGVLFLPEVVYKDSLFYLFYSGSPNMMTTALTIGYATSLDGYNWTKNTSNPVFKADGTGFDALQVDEGKILIENNLWTLYYNARSVGGPGPGPSIGRATSSSSDGPWDRMQDPVLKIGSPGEWDESFVTPNAVLATDSGYLMYYSGGNGYPFPPDKHGMIGLAFSPDGITWTKYDDPQTTNPPYAESDPVVSLGTAGTYDSGLAWECDVLKTDTGFEMFYTGDPDSWSGEKICYATSEDGIHWVKDSVNNPLLGPTQDWVTVDIVSPSVVKIKNTYFVYYDGNTSMTDGQIGLATSPIVTAVRHENKVTIKRYKLIGSYPNPFNPSTNIIFEVPNQSLVKIEIYNILGKLVTTLVNRSYSKGRHQVTWNGKDNNGRKVSSGTYVAVMRTKNYQDSMKMNLLK